MDSLRFLFFVTIRDALRPGRVIAWSGVAIATFLMAWMFAWLIPDLGSEILYGQFSLIFVYRLQALAAAVFGAAVLSQEVEERTIVYLVTRPMPRGPMLLARMLGVAVVVTAWSWAFAILAGIGTMGLGALSHEGFYKDLLVLPVGALAYTAIFSFVSLILNKALIYNLLFAFGWEAFVPNMPGTMYRISIHTYLKELVDHPSPVEGFGALRAMAGQVVEQGVSNWVAVVVLAAVILGGTALCMWWFAGHEYIPREDAE